MSVYIFQEGVTTSIVAPSLFYPVVGVANNRVNVMISTNLMTPQAKMSGFDPAVDAFAKIEIRLTPGELV